MLFVYLPLLLTVAICVFARPLGTRLGVIDYPDSDRKIHPNPTPLLGGIAIMLPLAVWCATKLAFLPAGGQGGFYSAVLLCGGGVAVLGFIDDQRMISPAGRLVLLAIFSVAALEIDPSLVVTRLHILAMGGWIPISPWLALVLVVVALTGFSSAVNLVDGLNGLVLLLILSWSICLALVGTDEIVQAAGFIAAASLVTLMFNMSGRLFLGDCGAFAVAFVLGLLAISAHNAGRLALDTALVWFFLPVADCLRLIPMRIWDGRSPFRPDRHHFHYRLAAWVGDTGASLGYSGFVAVTSVAATFAPRFAPWCLGIQFIAYLSFLLGDWLVEKGELAEEIEVTSNVVPLDKKPTARQ